MCGEMHAYKKSGVFSFFSLHLSTIYIEWLKSNIYPLNMTYVSYFFLPKKYLTCYKPCCRSLGSHMMKKMQNTSYSMMTYKKEFLYRKIKDFILFRMIIIVRNMKLKLLISQKKDVIERIHHNSNFYKHLVQVHLEK